MKKLSKKQSSVREANQKPEPISTRSGNGRKTILLLPLVVIKERVHPRSVADAMIAATMADPRVNRAIDQGEEDYGTQDDGKRLVQQCADEIVSRKFRKIFIVPPQGTRGLRSPDSVWVLNVSTQGFIESIGEYPRGEKTPEDSGVIVLV